MSKVRKIVIACLCLACGRWPCECPPDVRVEETEERPVDVEESENEQ